MVITSLGGRWMPAGDPGHMPAWAVSQVKRSHVLLEMVLVRNTACAKKPTGGSASSWFHVFGADIQVFGAGDRPIVVKGRRN